MTTKCSKTSANLPEETVMSNPIKIVLLDTNKLPKDMINLIAKYLCQFGEYKSYATTTLENIVDNAYAAEVILVNKAKLRAEHFNLLPNLKYVIVIATGYDCVDIAAAAKLNIPVSNIPGYGTEIVAQHTLALLLELTNQVGRTSYLVKHEYKWSNGAGYRHIELSGLRLGVIGFGAIAKAVIKVAIALGMQVLVYSKKAEYITDLPVRFVSKDELFCQSNIITLHCPCNEQTQHIINHESLAQMKSTVYLINTSRGGLVDEAALFDALSSGRIAGAALDVLEVEPASQDNPLFKLDNCLITPHNAWLSDGSLKRWIDIMVNNMRSYLNGKLINLI